MFAGGRGHGCRLRTLTPRTVHRYVDGHILLGGSYVVYVYICTTKDQKPGLTGLKSEEQLRAGYWHI